jgi:hypothetical protein
MADVTEKWRSERVTVALYDVGVQHASVAKLGVRSWVALGPLQGGVENNLDGLGGAPSGDPVLLG